MNDFQDFLARPKKMVLYCYSTRELEKKDKVRFYYALKGRDGKTGIVKRANINHIGKGVLLVPYTNEDELRQFFRVWNLDYTKLKVLSDFQEEIVKQP